MLDHGADPFLFDKSNENSAPAFFIAGFRGAASVVRLFIKKYGKEKIAEANGLDAAQVAEFLAEMETAHDRDPNDSD
jgi:hypothetical protein